MRSFKIKVCLIFMTFFVFMAAGVAYGKNPERPFYESFDHVKKAYCGEVASLPGVKVLCDAYSNEELLLQCGELRDSGEFHTVLTYKKYDADQPWLIINFISSDDASGGRRKVIVFQRKRSFLFFKKGLSPVFQKEFIGRQDAEQFTKFMRDKYGIYFLLSR